MASDGSAVFPKAENGQIVDAEAGATVNQGNNAAGGANDVKVLDKRILLDSLSIAKNGQINRCY